MGDTARSFIKNVYRFNRQSSSWVPPNIFRGRAKEGKNRTEREKCWLGSFITAAVRDFWGSGTKPRVLRLHRLWV